MFKLVILCKLSHIRRRALAATHDLVIIDAFQPLLPSPDLIPLETKAMEIDATEPPEVPWKTEGLVLESTRVHAPGPAPQVNTKALVLPNPCVCKQKC